MFSLVWGPRWDLGYSFDDSFDYVWRMFWANISCGYSGFLEIQPILIRDGVGQQDTHLVSVMTSDWDPRTRARYIYLTIPQVSTVRIPKTSTGQSHTNNDLQKRVVIKSKHNNIISKMNKSNKLFIRTYTFRGKTLHSITIKFSSKFQS